ncbi:uncharacterized protein LOC133303604 [Gastrolobium bilobum]|uniref:uncharacterized protein LOC133303604 n=1 Tax=Gastrolobium bilobum TaxID=150636 RepID=UPI002AB19913|nr:uncharacterized protein LOC133303604 [Gastrolobium bilobum]
MSIIILKVGQAAKLSFLQELFAVQGLARKSTILIIDDRSSQYMLRYLLYDIFHGMQSCSSWEHSHHGMLHHREPSSRCLLAKGNQENHPISRCLCILKKSLCSDYLQHGHIKTLKATCRRRGGWWTSDPDLDKLQV